VAFVQPLRKDSAKQKQVSVRARAIAWIHEAIKQLRVARTEAKCLHPTTPQLHLPLTLPFSFCDHGASFDRLADALCAIRDLHQTFLASYVRQLPAAFVEIAHEVKEHLARIDRIAFDEGKLENDRVQLRGWLLSWMGSRRSAVEPFDVRENRGVWFVDAIFHALAMLDPESLASRLGKVLHGGASGKTPGEFELAAHITSVMKKYRESGEKLGGLQVEVSRAAGVSESKLKLLLKKADYQNAAGVWRSACNELNRGRPRTPKPTIEEDTDRRTIDSIADNSDPRDRNRGRSAAR